MKYPIAIEMGGPKKSWGVVVPDLPGCFSAADSGIDVYNVYKIHACPVNN